MHGADNSERAPGIFKVLYSMVVSHHFSRGHTVTVFSQSDLKRFLCLQGPKVLSISTGSSSDHQAEELSPGNVLWLGFWFTETGLYIVGDAGYTIEGIYIRKLQYQLCVSPSMLWEYGVTGTRTTIYHQSMQEHSVPVLGLYQCRVAWSDYLLYQRHLREM